MLKNNKISTRAWLQWLWKWERCMFMWNRALIKLFQSLIQDISWPPIGKVTCIRHQQCINVR